MDYTVIFTAPEISRLSVYEVSAETPRKAIDEAMKKDAADYGSAKHHRDPEKFADVEVLRGHNLTVLRF